MSSQRAEEVAWDARRIHTGLPVEKASPAILVDAGLARDFWCPGGVGFRAAKPIPSAMQPRMAQWAGVPSLALRAFMGAREAGADAGTAATARKHPPSLALRAFMGAREAEADSAMVNGATGPWGHGLQAAC